MRKTQFAVPFHTVSSVTSAQPSSTPEGIPADGSEAGTVTDSPGHTAPGAGIPANSARRGWFKRLAVDTRPLRHVAYRRLWTSSVVTAMGSQMTAVAVPYQIYQLTHSSGWVGIASFCGLLPLIVFGLWGGAISDTMDRRTLMMLTNIGVAASSFALWVQAALHVDSVLLLILLLMVQQGMFGMNSPVRSATIPRLVPTEELPAANALGGTVSSVGALIGPMIGGALIPITGLSTLYLIDACGLIVTLWAVIRLPSLPPLESAPRRAGLTHIVEGVRQIRGTSTSQVRDAQTCLVTSGVPNASSAMILRTDS